ncbi:MAG: hypothetical protein JO354_10770, partial [Verrucomicrobia bacterium]|nr:hypothetical protein [Verrucomicrobiota bacterium]
PEKIAHAAKGGSTGAKISLSQPGGNGDKGQLTIFNAGRTQTIDVAQNLTRNIPLQGTELTARIDKYWPDFRMINGKPVSVSDAPNNAAVVVTITGRGVPVDSGDAPHGGTNPPEMNETNAAQNHLTIFIADDDSLAYELASRRNGASSGTLDLGKPLVTGWADWQLVADKVLPHAQQWMDFRPAGAASANDLPDGVRVRVEQNGQMFDQWVPSGWQIAIPTSPQPLPIEFGFRAIPLPIALELLKFEVTRNEGSDAPAGFKSTVRVSTADGESAAGQCWMNHPYSFPNAWWRTWTGMTFKMSQASWNPENLNQSTIQILRDPGWLLKWVGSLLIVVGVFLMFYVKQFRRPLRTKQTQRAETAVPEPAGV